MRLNGQELTMDDLMTVARVVFNSERKKHNIESSPGKTAQEAQRNKQLRRGLRKDKVSIKLSPLAEQLTYSFRNRAS